jgi:hypothetical protein
MIETGPISQQLAPRVRPTFSPGTPLHPAGVTAQLGRDFATSDRLPQIPMKQSYLPCSFSWWHTGNWKSRTSSNADHAMSRLVLTWSNKRKEQQFQCIFVQLIPVLRVYGKY